MKRTMYSGALALLGVMLIASPAPADDNASSNRQKSDSQNQDASADRDRQQDREQRDARAKNRGDQRDNDRDSNRNRSDRDRSASDRNKNAQNARGDQRDRRSNSMRPDAGQRSSKDREADEAADFLAGYYAGYADGYGDGNDDSIYYIIDLHRQNQRQQRAGQSDSSTSAGAASSADDNRSGDARERNDRDNLSGHRRRARDAAREGRSTGASSNDQSRLLDGRVIESWTSQHGQRPHTLARVRAESGDVVLVDLGPTKNLRDAKLEEGDDIAVRGQRDDDGRRFVAREAWINDGPTLSLAGASQSGGSDRDSSANRDEASDRESRR